MRKSEDPIAKTSLKQGRQLSERLIKERSKALEILQTQTDKSKGNVLQSRKSSNVHENNETSKPSISKSDVKGWKSSINKNACHNNERQLSFPKKNLNKTDLPSRNSSSKLNDTDYVPPRHRDTIDISDLVREDSITLESSSMWNQESIGKRTDVSFHPAEITGRSTLHNFNSQNSKSSKISVDEILASSFSKKVRENLRESLIGCAGIERPSMASSCISDLSDMQRNPRLTHISENSFQSNAELNDHRSKASNVGFSFNNTSKPIVDTTLSDDNFVSGDMMQSQLLEDEIIWAKKFAAMPTAILSKEAKNKLPTRTSSDDRLSSMNSPSSSSWNSLALKDPNFSVGLFFKMKSDNIENIIQNASPEKNRTPITLISDSMITTSTTPNSPNETLESIALSTPAVSKKTYKISIKNDHTAKLGVAKFTGAENYESKDSGNGTEKFDLLALDRALVNLKIQDDSSHHRIANETLSKAKKAILNNLCDDMSPIQASTSTSISTNNLKTIQTPIESIDLVKHAEQLSNIAEMILENKENIDISNGQGQRNEDETLSFTESLLNSSIQNYRMSNAGQARSPLGPIPIVLTESLVDGDTENFLNSQNVRENCKKSPQISPNGKEIIANDYNESKRETETTQKKLSFGNKSPVNQVPSAPTVSGMITKSLSSSHSSKIGNCDVSPSHTKFSKTLTPTQFGESNASNSFELSPLSSPLSCFSSSGNSPVGIATNFSSRGLKTYRKNYNNCGSSPSFDTTTNSEQRYLGAVAGNDIGGLRRVASSPEGNQVNAANCIKRGNAENYGVPLMRTYSSTSVRSTESTSTRSVSRCSNNSEFSHPDGKMLPLKSNFLQLSWGSVKLRTCSQKSIQVKNTFHKRLVVRIEICGPGFELVSPTSNLLSFQSQECRTIIINFRPTVTGVAIGKFVFKSPRSQNSSTDKVIPLYAYGGHSNIIIQNILKGPIGAPFLPMGDLCALVQPLKRTFQIFNKGPLTGFAIVCIESSGLHLPGLSTAFEVFPQCILIEPQSFATVDLVFQPTREDIKKIQMLINDVLTLVKMRIIYGDEAMRQRLRQIQGGLSKDTREKLFTKHLDMLWTKFPNEHAVFPADIFKEEGAGLIQDMWSNLSEQEIVLTINNNMLDETAADLSTIFTETDNSILFQTMYVASPTNQLETVNELLEESSHYDHP